MVIKYFTGETFDRGSFARLLREVMNVPAYALEDGVLLDRDAFMAIQPAAMPTWAFVNRDDIKSALHTRPATDAEINLVWRPKRYQLVAMFGDSWTQIDTDATTERLKIEADMIAKANAIAIIDANTGEVVYEVEA